MNDILIYEVGARDGLQNEAVPMYLPNGCLQWPIPGKLWIQYFVRRESIIRF